MAEYKLTTRLFSESCSIVNGMELDLFPWLRFLPNQNFKKLTHARDLLDRWIDRELENAKVGKKRYWRSASLPNERCLPNYLNELKFKMWIGLCWLGRNFYKSTEYVINYNTFIITFNSTESYFNPIIIKGLRKFPKVVPTRCNNIFLKNIQVSTKI